VLHEDEDGCGETAGRADQDAQAQREDLSKIRMTFLGG
jgi:hypothetical protein